MKILIGAVIISGVFAIGAYFAGKPLTPFEHFALYMLAWIGLNGEKK